MRSLKDKGMEEVTALKNRTARQFGANRICREDHDRLQDLLDEVQTAINNMREDDDE